MSGPCDSPSRSIVTDSHHTREGHGLCGRKPLSIMRLEGSIILGEESGRKALMNKALVETISDDRSTTDNVLIYDRRREQVCHAAHI